MTNRLSKSERTKLGEFDPPRIVDASGATLLEMPMLPSDYEFKSGDFDDGNHIASDEDPFTLEAIELAEQQESSFARGVARGRELAARRSAEVAEPCNCDQSIELQNRVAMLELENEYLRRFCDAADIAQMRKDLAAEWEKRMFGSNSDGWESE